MDGPLGLHSLEQFRKGEYVSSIGSAIGSTKLPSGTYTVAATGGPDVGSFTASMNSADVLWIDKTTTTVVDRSSR